ncbi:unnamed protein product [Sphacelaria rigidula]
MKCILANKYGKFDEVLTMSDEWPKPTLDPKGGQMLLRVEACSLSPGDTLFLTGDCSFVMKAPSFPFVPGMDVCGVVEEIEGSAKFKVGDRVIASNGILPVGGLAEYMAVSTKNAVLAPAGLDIVELAALPNSPISAILCVRAMKVKAGDRVLVLGGSGGVGTSLVQLARDAGASFVATTSTDAPLMTSLGVDQVIDYRTTKWWEMPDFIDAPFDVVVDCVGWRDEWVESARTGALKPGRKGGRYIVIASTDEPKFRTLWEGLRLFMPTLWRMLWTTLNRWKPSYKLVICDPVEGDWPELKTSVEEKRLKPVLDPASPFPFTIEGVKQAFALQASKHAHGKVVIKLAE